ncbi:flavodoxin, short chain [[Clostridium] aminophilum]|uniref:Flavodoxin n=1 Tax=[Clostridium] aminophilum TaxID=1526 RepID=A0A1I0I6U7_9FIRM|nr:flavodoxin [[Clostridium] aminophilum]SET92423.1 flavodoxin, short chain [[Clostridium] aminophilum]
MSKVAVVYWSGTGNTEAMAAYVAQGAKNAGASVSQFTAGEFSASKLGEFDGIAFGCPSMGDEVLEETEFQPMWDEVKGRLAGKKVGLFGSWGWGGGIWMDNWKAECDSLGIALSAAPVICNAAPDAEAGAECEALGQAVA